VSLDLELVQSAARLEALEPEWQSLYRRDPAATPFQSPAWLIPWTRHLLGGGRLRVLALRHGADLAALAPLYLWGYGSKPEIVRVSFLGSGISDHLGMLAAPPFALAAARLVLDHLAESSGEWHVCDFQELSHGSPLLRTEMPPGLAARQAPCGVCPVLALPRAIDALFAGLEPKFRHNLQTARNRLRRAGAVEIVRAQSADCEFWLHELFLLRGRDPVSLQRFHKDAAARLAAAGDLRLYALRLNGRTLAVQYSFLRDGRLYYYLSGFDPAHARFSPGAVLLAETIRLAMEEGVSELDFLRRGENFKYQWGARDRTNRKLLVSPSAGLVRNVA
jgi:CelD/BcsL family acetyltransferase involved in cellulose biosynthesis